jgi:hypothetical protein
MMNQVFSMVPTNPLGFSDVGTLAAPSFADIDNDGDLDAFVGEGFGNTFYKNLGLPAIQSLLRPLSIRLD